jgi:hypothetical protein
MKKAQSISINTIVVAAIALVVMVLLILIVTQNLGGFRRSTASCESSGGSCISFEDVSELCSRDNFKTVRYDLACFNGKDPDPDKVCCTST